MRFYIQARPSIESKVSPSRNRVCDVVVLAGLGLLTRPADGALQAAGQHPVDVGATGYLQKETDRERLLSAMRTVALGELRLPADVVRRTFKALRDGAGTGDAAAEAGLTPREREILVSFVQGMSYARIAEARGIKPVTARNAIYGIQQKLSVGTMQELVLWCVHNGLLDDYTTDGFRGYAPPDNL